MHDVGVRDIELAGGIQAIAFFGDRDRHQTRGGILEPGKGAIGRGRRDDIVLETAQNAKSRRHLQLCQCVEIILPCQRLSLRPSTQCNSNHAPARNVRQPRLDVGGNMGALERTRTEMNDAGRDHGAVVSGNCDSGRDRRKRRLGES